MTRLTNRFNRLAASVAVALASVAGAAITINGPTLHTASVPLTGLPQGWTGTVALNPDPVTYLAPPAANSVFMQQFVVDVGQYPGWTAVPGAALSGTALIDRYQARDLGNRTGGAAMVATYTPANGENAANFRWLQMFNSTNSGRHIDPFPRNYNHPFYYTEAEHAQFGMQFRDFPSIGPVPTPFTFSATFDVYLSTANFGAKTATVHDGWRWGYTVTVTPAPGPMALVACGGLLAFRRRR